MEKRALGRGLDALISSTTIDMGTEQHERVIYVPIDQVKANKYQPRIEFNQEKLNELISSIQEKGVVQPVLVRKTDTGYELIAGERRLRAAKSLGMDKLPAIVKNVDDVDMLEISLIENIQREELSPIEEANAFQRFITDFQFTQEKIAKVLGKDRSTVANILRLLGLPKKIQDFLSKGIITTGHAKALLSMQAENDQVRVCNLIVKKGLSVREVENLVARRLGRYAQRAEVKKDAGISDIENTLQKYLGTRVRVLHGKKRGKIQIEYYSQDDLNRVLDLIMPKAQ